MASKQRQGWRSFRAMVLAIAAGLVLDGAGYAQQSYIRPETVSNRFYAAMPSFPKEDQYKPSNRQNFTPSTLVERLVQYHTMIKGRNPQLRFDWKLTLADYLGLNDVITVQNYPGSTFLTRNPLDGDRTAIRQLSRQQRLQLIQTLVSIYTPVATTSTPATPNPASLPTAVPIPPTPAPLPGRPPLLPLPRGGDSQLLAPPAPPTTPSPTIPQPNRPTGDAQLLLP